MYLICTAYNCTLRSLRKVRSSKYMRRASFLLSLPGMGICPELAAFNCDLSAWNSSPACFHIIKAQVVLVLILKEKKKNLISVSQETPLNEATRPAKASLVANRACLMLNRNQNIEIDKKECLGVGTGIQKHRKQSTEARQGRSRARRQVNLKDMSCWMSSCTAP